ncbi:hypothetical protein CICLE_v10024618mg [Citrus x clementina]|uniref:Uncharacterized protein n=1 Tax=Citrus clementina TaxID=85681 RepID=V4TUH4_CITCL|nr:hypothetical protein CICLE_v10024618mg [Citrus x clementina]
MPIFYKVKKKKENIKNKKHFALPNCPKSNPKSRVNITHTHTEISKSRQSALPSVSPPAATIFSTAFFLTRSSRASSTVLKVLNFEY